MRKVAIDARESPLSVARILIALCINTVRRVLDNAEITLRAVK